ncbi:GNAT family N-acetyltransferase [Aeromicrobium ginsengisoli]|uniref:GNAT family N-acetyltransferase n=2 Tax=Aeromicrobium ginsengisoli TaxID=363867 RepID=A0A5M4FKH6_9ACTN|nr:GNAT family N-acetyltransferase [Aeromicrobium ginsengisoli]
MWTGANDTEERWRARLADGPCFIAYDDERPVGMVAGRVVGGAAELISMWVAPEARRRGIGRTLIERVVAWADGRPLSLRVMDGNAPAVTAYERQGFVLQDDIDGEGCRRMLRPA